MADYKGVWTALATPFRPDGSIDLTAYRRLLEAQKAAGVAGVVPCGTTGESPTLSDDEKKTLIQEAMLALKGSGVRVMAGTGSNDTRRTVEASRWAAEQGVDAVLVVCPYYNKPSQAGLEAHFRAVADAVSCDVIIYNVPGRTGSSISAETVARLAKHARIPAIKEATGNPAFASEIATKAAAAGGRMEILSGDDLTFLPLLSIGATGCISVASNVIPAELVALHRKFSAGDLAGARALHDRYFGFFQALFVESNPVPVKYALSRLGVCGASLRLPLVELSAESRKIMDRALAECGIGGGR